MATLERETLHHRNGNLLNEADLFHDIRTTLNAIMGFAAIAAAHLDDRDKVQDCISKVTISSRQLLSVMDELLPPIEVDDEQVCNSAVRMSVKADKESECRQNENCENLFGKQVLLAEDNELNREVAVDILTEEGLIVDTVENGAAAVAKIAAAEEGAYDIILMDIQMPAMDGYEAANAIRALDSEWTRKLPILAMTANAFEEDRKKALEAGMNGYLAKPIDIDGLFQTLAGILK